MEEGTEAPSSSLNVIPSPVQKGMDTPYHPKYLHCVPKIFHYLHINVPFISDLHQARQWFPTLAYTQLAIWKIFSQLHYLYLLRDWREKQNKRLENTWERKCKLTLSPHNGAQVIHSDRQLPALITAY